MIVWLIKWRKEKISYPITKFSCWLRFGFAGQRSFQWPSSSIPVRAFPRIRAGQPIPKTRKFVAGSKITNPDQRRIWYNCQRLFECRRSWRPSVGRSTRKRTDFCTFISSSLLSSYTISLREFYLQKTL